MPVILEYIPFQMERDMHLQQTESQKKCLPLNITLTSLYNLDPVFPYHIQLTLAISNSLISNNLLSRSENLVPV